MGVDGGFVTLFLLTNSKLQKGHNVFNNYFIHYFKNNFVKLSCALSAYLLTGNMEKMMNYWHMQMFPGNAPELDKNVPWIIQNRKFIGLGDWDEKRNQIGDFCERMQVNDIVAIKNGAEFIALVQIIGGVYSIKDDEDERTSWIVYRRPVRVLDWEIDGKEIRECPQPRGTLNICQNEDVETSKVIKNWHERACSSFKKRGINLTV